MPKEDEVTEVVVEEPASKPVVEEKPALEVDLAEKDTPAPSSEEQLAAKIKADYEKLYGGRLEQVENRLRGAQRISERLQKENEALKQRLPAPVSPAPDDRKAQRDALVEKGDWQTAVAQIAEEKAEALYQQRQALEQQQALLRAQQDLLEASKRTVIERYTDLDPETGNPESEVSKAYADELNKDPQLRWSPYGPEIAMYRMEQRLGKTQNGRESAETQRQRRVGQTSLSPSRPAAPGTKVTIDKDQKEFLDYHGVDPKLYAQVKQSLEQQGSVEA